MAKFNYYDKIASIYDQTRWMTTAVAEDVATVILNLVQATPTTSFLEPGIGTGLNVLPLVQRGYSVTGIDISSQMLDQFRQKLTGSPANLTLIHADSSQLPLADQSFDVVLTVHMVHTVADWKVFLDEIDRVLKPNGFYLNAQWITPPARKKFEEQFKAIASKYEQPKPSNQKDTSVKKIDVEAYCREKGYQSTYLVAREWMVTDTVDELIKCFKLKPYGLCWRMSDDTFNLVMSELEEFCHTHYGSLQSELSSEAKFEVWAYSR
ncbi:MAG: class I SAM-dependent methyltransferase [Phormidesmis sp.]